MGMYYPPPHIAEDVNRVVNDGAVERHNKCIEFLNSHIGPDLSTRKLDEIMGDNPDSPIKTMNYVDALGETRPVIVEYIQMMTDMFMERGSMNSDDIHHMLMTLLCIVRPTERQTQVIPITQPAEEIHAITTCYDISPEEVMAISRALKSKVRRGDFLTAINSINNTDLSDFILRAAMQLMSVNIAVNAAVGDKEWPSEEKKRMYFLSFIVATLQKCILVYWLFNYDATS